MTAHGLSSAMLSNSTTVQVDTQLDIMLVMGHWDGPWFGQYVYFAQRAGAVKIGCSANPTRRMTQLGRPRPALLGMIVGGFDVERELHGLFAADRLGAEWFRRSPALDRLIDTLPADAEAAQELAGWPTLAPRPAWTFVDLSPAQRPDLPPVDLLDHHAAYLYGEHVRTGRVAS